MLILTVILMTITVPVTAAICRFRVSRSLRVSYGTVIAGAAIVALVWLACVFPSAFSYNSHHDAQHKWDPNWLSSLLRLTEFIAVICLIPALAVVTYYQNRFFGPKTGSPPE
jgi:hypothetical protein